ncbi:CBS domain-containing protein [Actinokineospora sp. NBRC 105648]|uniref:CBS domain-containing protein n=1 Tax=Actinokineospora sp. NBRC 105648 TaxID=3032206 RepID=UPI0024A388D4|nr:CBS domain-containing protein [Actinokineospora sp. NBRC 105648]GLZ36677.1 CBS domain-containing protein [Actinokineospora sp. NBRC 105648]
MRARDVMSAPVLTVRPGTPVKRAAELLAGKGYTALPVVDEDDRLVGVVTEADVLRDRFPTDPRFRTDADDADRPLPATVAEVMTTPAVAMSAGTDAAVLARVMIADRRRCVPIVDGSRLVGVVTRRDLVRVLARPDNEVATDLRRRLALIGGPGRWTVRVAGGTAEITDRYDEAADRHVAKVLAEAVPGVVHANVHSEPENAV